MKTKLKMLALILSLSGLYAGIAHSAERKGAHKASKKSDSVTILDFSTPDAPESKLPEVAKKGPL